jgi:hypothetical protein
LACKRRPADDGRAKTAYVHSMTLEPTLDPRNKETAVNIEPSFFHFCPRCNESYGPMRGCHAASFVCICEGGSGTPRYSEASKAQLDPGVPVHTVLAAHRSYCTQAQRDIADRLASFAPTPPERLRTLPFEAE